MPVEFQNGPSQNPSELTKTQPVSYVSKINHLIGTSRQFKAGQLQMHLTGWKAITSDL